MNTMRDYLPPFIASAPPAATLHVLWMERL